MLDLIIFSQLRIENSHGHSKWYKQQIMIFFIFNYEKILDANQNLVNMAMIATHVPVPHHLSLFYLFYIIERMQEGLVKKLDTSRLDKKIT